MAYDLAWTFILFNFMKRSDLVFSAILLPLDYIMLVLAALAAYALRYQDWVQEIRPVIFNLDFKEYFNYAWIIALGWLIIFAIAGLYQIKGSRKIFSEISKVFLACSTAVLAIIVAAFFSRELFDSRFILLAVWIFSILFVVIYRLIIRLVQKLFYKIGYGVHKTVLIGNDSATQDIAKELHKDHNLGYKIINRFSDFSQTTQEKMNSICQNTDIDEIIQADANLPRQQNLALLDFANFHHITFKYAADLLATQVPRFNILTLAGVPIIEVSNTALDGWGKILKRFFDIIFSFLGLMLI